MSLAEYEGQPIVFLDRDGVLNVDKYITYRPEQFELIEGVIEGLLSLQMLGFSLMIITNQSVIGRGIATEEEVSYFNTMLVDRLKQEGIHIADVFVCPHDPVFGIGAYRFDCACRKPKPGMFWQAADKYRLRLAECYFIGDKKSDVVAGHNAGCRTILVETGILDDELTYPKVTPHYRVKNLRGAALIIAGELAIKRMRIADQFPLPFNEAICARLRYE